MIFPITIRTRKGALNALRNATAIIHEATTALADPDLPENELERVRRVLGTTCENCGAPAEAWGEYGALCGKCRSTRAAT